MGESLLRPNVRPKFYFLIWYTSMFYRFAAGLGATITIANSWVFHLQLLSMHRPTHAYLLTIIIVAYLVHFLFTYIFRVLSTKSSSYYFILSTAAQSGTPSSCLAASRQLFSVFTRPDDVDHEMIVIERWNKRSNSDINYDIVISRNESDSGGKMNVKKS